MFRLLQNLWTEMVVFQEAASTFSLSQYIGRMILKWSICWNSGKEKWRALPSSSWDVRTAVGSLCAPRAGVCSWGRLDVYSHPQALQTSSQQVLGTPRDWIHSQSSQGILKDLPFLLKPIFWYLNHHRSLWWLSSTWCTKLIGVL